MNSDHPYANCRRADAHGYGLTVTNARTDARVECEIVSHSIDGFPGLEAIELENEGVEGLRHGTIDDAVGIADDE